METPWIRESHSVTASLFLSCLKDLCGAHPDNLATILKHTIFNELSNAR